MQLQIHLLSDMAEQRGVEVRLTQATESDEYRNVTTLKAVLSDGSVVSAGGTVIGPKHHQKVVSINETWHTHRSLNSQ